MSAEPPAVTLRRAAELMRQRAEAATPGPWKHMCLGSEGCLVLRNSGTIRERRAGRVARFGSKEWLDDHAEAEYVAAMHPGVAVALAEWLDAIAEDVDKFGEDCHSRDAALAIARAYLGEAAS